MYDALRRHAVQVLHDAGMSLTKITEQLGISRAVVCRILKEAPMTELPQERKAVSDVGRPAVVKGYEWSAPM